jgi:hypothetical protein
MKDGDIIKMDFRRNGWGGVDWIYIVQDRKEWLAPLNNLFDFGFHKILEKSWVIEQWRILKVTLFGHVPYLETASVV